MAIVAVWELLLDTLSDPEALFGFRSCTNAAETRRFPRQSQVDKVGRVLLLHHGYSNVHNGVLYSLC